MLKQFMFTTKYLFLLILSFGLVACGGSKTVETFDNSVDYKNAISLPPLKKPSNQRTTQISIPATSETAITEGSQQETDAPIVIQDLNVTDIRPIAETEDTDRISVEQNIPQVELPEQTSEAFESVSNSSVNARVIEPNSNSVRLQIDEGFETSWAYINENLKLSDITVYNRNETAGQFAIGCGDMESEPKVTKRGGWSFFNRKPQKTDNCTLQLASSRSNTTVTVLSRSGEEVSPSASRYLFARLLNN